MKTTTLFATSVTGTPCWLLFNLVPARAPKSFSVKLLSSWVAPRMYWCTKLFPPQVQDLTLVLVELLKVAVSLFFQPDEMPLDGSMIFCYISHSSQCVSPENPLRVNSAPASKSLMKMLDRNGPNIGHVFYFHVLCHQGPCPLLFSVFSSLPFATYNSSSWCLCHYCPD